MSLLRAKFKPGDKVVYLDEKAMLWEGETVSTFIGRQKGRLFPERYYSARLVSSGKYSNVVDSKKIPENRLHTPFEFEDLERVYRISFNA